MTNRTLYLFTDSWPYGNSESFLQDESHFLSKTFSVVRVIPLHKDNGIMRNIPANFVVMKSLLNEDPKHKIALLKSGVFNSSPLFFAFKLFFKEKAYKSRKRIWNFVTSLLVFRSAYKSFKLLPSSNDLLYFYWGDKSINILPFLKQKFKTKAIARFHGSDLYEEVKGGYIPFRKRVLPYLDMAAPISEYGHQYLKKYGFLCPNRIETSRLGVLDNGLNPTASNDNTLNLLTCSNIIKIKRLSLLLEAVMYLPFNVKWTHIGSGPLLKDLKEQSKQCPDNIKINWMGQQNHEFVMQLYAKQHFDIFVNVSETEGIPVSIMEALSFGIPVLATKVGGVAEIIDENVGYLVSKDIKSDELASLLTNFYANKANAELRNNARKRFETMCDANENYSHFCSTIENL
ncbi:MAG: glycosyltransferase [Bacteroidia bacterium]|nr:glycosyltransferase [Bacteroidia bacterium]